MSDFDHLRQSFTNIVEMVGDPLIRLAISPIAAQHLEEYVARLSFHVAPSYLPFATDDSGIFCVHTWPGRDTARNPLVYVPTDEQEAHFLCDGLRSLPAAVWLWVCTYYKSESEVLLQATDELAARIPEGKRVLPKLWDYLEDDPVRWSASDPRINEAWAVADVGHPFAGMPSLDFLTEVEEAMPLLEPFVQLRRHEPEVLSMYLAARAKAGQPRSESDVLTVLSAESWRNLSCTEGLWRENGRGICEWDCTLKNVENPEAAFRVTAFEPLIGHPNAYSGEDREGPMRLRAVADTFRSMNDRQSELRQSRNAATLAILVQGKYPLGFAEQIARTCDAIVADSLAAAIARESARVHEQGP